MQGNQKTLESFAEKDRAEPEGYREEAVSIPVAQSVEEVTYGNLIDAVLEDDNIDRALKKVVGNRGSPGIDGMSVDELESWLETNRRNLKDAIRSGEYVPTPVRRKEIPKPNGGVRNLGIPTAKDRLVQQMIAQVLEPIYDPTFSESSYGFRPGRSAQDAVMKVGEYYEQGYSVAVGLDLEKFFDTLNQRYLMNILRERIKDKVLIQLIKRFLRAGAVMPDGITQATPKGSPQGGPLSPLLSNIYLDKFDKELESRSLHFCRYADDSLILVKSRRSAERVCQTVTRYLEGELLLKVNREKTEIGSPKELKFLGFKLSRRKDGVGFIPHQSSIAKFKKRVREMTKRNRSVSLGRMLAELGSYMKGWMGYFGMTTSGRLLEDLDGWVRRRVRQYIFKQWKRPYTRFTNLYNLCPPYMAILQTGEPSKDWERYCWNAAMMESYWKAAGSTTVERALSNSWLSERGMYFLSDDWKRTKERCFNRRVGAPTHGGVRGRTVN